MWSDLREKNVLYCTACKHLNIVDTLYFFQKNVTRGSDVFHSGPVLGVPASHPVSAGTRFSTITIHQPS